MTESASDVVQWLNAMPMQDNPRGSIWRSEPVTAWQQWVDSGRALHDTEQQLLTMLQNEADAFRRSRIVLALGWVGTIASVPALVDRLSLDVALVAAEAAAGLGRIGIDGVVEPLCMAVKHRDSNVRANACMALGRMKTMRARECVMQALGDADPFVRSVATKVLDAKDWVR